MAGVQLLIARKQKRTRKRLPSQTLSRMSLKWPTNLPVGLSSRSFHHLPKAPWETIPLSYRSLGNKHPKHSKSRWSLLENLAQHFGVLLSQWGWNRDFKINPSFCQASWFRMVETCCKPWISWAWDLIKFILLWTQFFGSNTMQDTMQWIKHFAVHRW